MVYLTLIILLVLLIYHYDYQGHQKGRRECFIFIAIYFILMAGLRYRIGGDTVNYSYNYPYYPDLFSYWSYDFNSSRFGRGYLFLGAVAKTISNNFVALQCVLSVFVNTILFRFFYRNTVHIFTAALLYFLLLFFPLNTEVLRESCAVAMFILGWKYFYKKKWLKYYLCCVGAFLFHSGAIFTFLLPLCNLKVFRKLFTPSLFSASCALVFFILGVIITSKFFDIIQLVGFAVLDDYAQTYQDSKFAAGRGFNLVGSLTFIIRNLVYPLTFAWLVSKKMVSSPNEKNFDYQKSLMVMFMVFIYIASLSTSLIILGRFNNYLHPFLIVVLSDVFFNKIKTFKHRYKLSFSVWNIILLPFLFLNTYGYFESKNDAGTANIHRYYPYASVLNPKLDRERELLIHYIYFR